ncbi:40S ribosomal protein S30, putative [Ixodes scapularis]|uniref:40S ribosomal protein S30, putative n=1 Tax=Ixodes scapularis TaxID=6945 RepID=B7P217_IXOSC|nr:40S ribosomal protein S30, putative [Ixodes scapularis]|eukprot:XP_002401341.1 40S ribosomal protein S30, putative [Ixodes scapularis]
MKLILNCQEVHAIEVTGDETVAFLKNYLQTAEGIAAADQCLYSAGKPLSDEELLSACLSDGSRIDAVVPLLGGKERGKLAIQKDETLLFLKQVDKQEKKKKKTGRAKRRIQYNRRFVNAVATFGRRRGPNTNQTS